MPGKAKWGAGPRQKHSGGKPLKVIPLWKGEILNEGLESQTYIPAGGLFRWLRNRNLHTGACTPESSQSAH
jgi:hypothetical protein